MIFFTDGTALNFLLGVKWLSSESGCNFGLRCNVINPCLAPC